MAQRKLTVAEYIALTDAYADGIAVMFAAKGLEATPATLAAYCAAVRNTITAFAAPDEADITVDLLPAAMACVDRAELESDVASLFAGFNAAVLGHLGSDLNAWLTADGSRVHHLWRRGGNTAIQPVNVFPPVTILGSFAVTGAGAGVFTDGSAVDLTRYADAQLEVEVINQPIGGANVDVTVVGTNRLGGAYSETVQIPSGSIVGTKVAIGTSADRCANVTNVTIENGTNGDDFQVQTKEDR